MLNNTVLIGRLTKDPDLRYTPNGTAVCNFTLAVDNPFKKEDPKADFIPIVVFKKIAEASANYLRKGRLCAIEGRIQTRNYENNEGRRVYMTEVIANSVKFLESKNIQELEEIGAKIKSKDEYESFTISDDDLPF